VASEVLVEGVDYYIEAGRWVFTAHYLWRRGYCCESGCRHCPYGYLTPAPIDDRDMAEEAGPGQS